MGRFRVLCSYHREPLFAAFLISGFVFAVHFAWAATIPSIVPLYGYAWSDTIGWISFNCVDGGPGGSDICASSGGTSDYQVQINTDGSLSGYAWSDNIGWIKFGGLGMPPAQDSDGISTAMLTGSSSVYELTGWARACSATLNGNCTGSLHPDGGGWDGWISLNCNNLSNGCDPVTGSNYQIRVGYNNMLPGSFAWGADVVGWVLFDWVTFAPPCSISGQCVNSDTQIEYTDQFCSNSFFDCVAPNFCQSTPTLQCAELIPTGWISATPGLVRDGGTSLLEWSTVDAASCRVIQDGNEIYNGFANGTTTSATVNNSLEVSLYCKNVYNVEYLIDSATIDIVPHIEEL